MYDILIPTITRPLLSFPFDYVVLKKQINDKNISYFEIFSKMKNENILVKKFLKIHMIELITKSSVYSIYYYSKKYSSQLEISSKYKFIPDLFATSLISCLDIFIINPFERIKISTINKKQIPKLKISNYKWFINGGSLTFISSFLHVGSFLSMNNLTKKYYFENKEKKMTLYDSIIIGSYTSIIQSIFTYPFITLRSRFQHENILVYSSVKDFIFNKNNYKNLYSGLTSRFLRGFMLVIFDTYWINNIK